MTPYQNILACIDLSQVSQHVLSRANELADFYKAHLAVLYVNLDMPAINEPFGEPPSLLLDVELRQKLEERAKQELKHIVAASGLSNLVPVEMIDGHPKTVILDYEKKHHIDLIVMGRHKRPAILNLLGSTANTVLHKANADVLLIAGHENE